MQSGRVGSIDLSQEPTAVEALRALLRSQGAVPVHNEESPAGQGEGSEITTTTIQEAGMTMSIETPSADTRQPLRPIYGPQDPRWQQLAEWFERNADRLVNDDGSSTATLEELWPSERVLWHATHVLGVDATPFDVEFPKFPENATPPVWAAGGEPSDGGVTECDELPLQIWDHRLIDESNVSVDLIREDTFDPASAEVVVGAEALSVWIGGEQVKLADATPDGLRTIAGVLLKAANAAEREMRR